MGNISSAFKALAKLGAQLMFSPPIGTFGVYSQLEYDEEFSRDLGALETVARDEDSDPEDDDSNLEEMRNE